MHCILQGSLPCVGVANTIKYGHFRLLGDFFQKFALRAAVQRNL